MGKNANNRSQPSARADLIDVGVRGIDTLRTGYGEETEEGSNDGWGFPLKEAQYDRPSPISAASYGTPCPARCHWVAPNRKDDRLCETVQIYSQWDFQ